jgi:hypothetical protein
MRPPSSDEWVCRLLQRKRISFQRAKTWKRRKSLWNSLEHPPLGGGISATLRRHLQHLVKRSLADFPVVLFTGVRQAGKSTLIRALI